MCFQLFSLSAFQLLPFDFCFLLSASCFSVRFQLFSFSAFQLLSFNFCFSALNKVDLSKFSAGEFERGASPMKELVWLMVSLVLFRLCPLKLSALKCHALRLFGARVGRGVVHQAGGQNYLSLEAGPG